MTVAASKTPIAAGEDGSTSPMLIVTVTSSAATNGTSSEKPCMRIQ